ncbi:ankyrin repeat domain-containing protein [Rickettsia endosymbiont of Cantharis rufa]|uniref:ankyrin repeat domain-containing protein n=1 Tax=Rickettsia endosymbiont of Cantharis rufa TaxID=3066248 RepID=UPI003979E72C
MDSEDVRLIEYLVNHILVGKNTGQQALLEKVAQIYDKNINISKLAKVLIKNGAEFDKALGRKLLQKAVYADDLELVETLYDKGVNVKHQDQLGRTALNHAIKANCGKELLQFLIEHGDCNSRDKSGSTPLHWAANNHHTIATKLLLEADACPYIPDYLGQTPLSLVEYYGHDDIAGILGAVVHGF